MYLRYLKTDGAAEQVALSDKPLTIGRSPKADIVLDDEKASRLHCGIRYQDGEYFIKDLSSKNGTYLNNERVEFARLSGGDRIKVGACTLIVMDEADKGTTTLMHEMHSAMDQGKGYHTLLNEIVKDSHAEKA